MTKIKKQTLSKMFRLFEKQPWLAEKEKENALLDILDECPNFDYQELIFELLGNFHYMDSNIFGKYQQQIADFIVKDSNFDVDTTQVVATAYDNEADSSQAILQSLKVLLAKKGWGKVQTVNTIGKCVKNKKLFQVILVDEFVGSGTTIVNRINWLKKNVTENIIIKCCFIAGIEFGLKKIERDCNIEIYCPLILKRGMTDFFDTDQLEKYHNIMLELENKDCHRLHEDKFQNYSLGYNKAEALYSAEGISGNTPNSVFPIFWWPLDKQGNKSQRILSRYEKQLHENLGI